METLSLGSGIAIIGDSAFHNCNALTTVTIGDDTAIGDQAFSACGALTTVTIGDNASIGDGAFSSCRALTTVAIGDNTSIGKCAFEYCDSLTSFNLPDSLTYIGEGAFRGSYALQLFDLSAVPDVIMAKETPLDNKAAIPPVLVRATNGKANLSWSSDTPPAPYDGPDAWNVAQVHYRSSNWTNAYLTVYSTGKIILSCVDEYTGARGSKEVSIETGIELRGAPAYLTSGQSATLKAYRMPDNKLESVSWQLREEDTAYASLSTSYGSSVKLTAKTVDRAVQVKLTAIPNSGSDDQELYIWVLPKTTGVSIFEGKLETPADQTDVTGQTVPVDMYAQNTLQLSPRMQPADALNAVTWKSSSSTVATVDQNGLVTLKKPGTVTITATAKDGSGKTASVKLSVSYLDTASKLTAKADVPTTGLESGFTTQMLVYGADKENPITSGLTFSIPESQWSIATVDENTGLISAGSKAGTATVTAAITGDPLGRKVSMNVKVIALQTADLQLMPNAEASSASFVMLDESGAVTDDPAAAVELYVDKAALSGGNTLRIDPFARAIDSSGEYVDLVKPAVKWSTTDSRIATVAANSDGYATVTLKTDGACTITAVTSDYAKITHSLTIHVRDYTPRLGSTGLTLNSNLETGVSTPLLESYGKEISAVELYEYDATTKTYPDKSTRLTPSYEDGLLTITHTGSIKNSTIKLQLRVLCEDGAVYTHNISLKVANSLPTVTIKQPAKFNLNASTEAALTVTAKNAVISDVMLVEETSDTFILSDFDDGSGILTLEPAADYIKGSKPDSKVDMEIWLEGYSVPVRKTVTIGTSTAKPAVSVKQAATLNLFYRDSTATLQLTAAGMKISNAVLDENSTASFCEVEGFDPETGKLVIGLTPEYLDKEVKLDTSAALLVELEGVDTPIAKTVTIGTVTAKPSLSLTPSSSIINTKIEQDRTTVFSVYNKAAGQNLDLTECDVSTTAAFADLDVVDSDLLQLTLKGTSGGTAPILVQHDNWTQTIKLSHKVTVQTALPTPLPGSTTLKLNSRLPEVTAETTMKLNQSNHQISKITFTPTGKTQAIRDEAEKILLSYDAGQITASFKSDDLPANGTYTFSYVVTLADEAGTSLPAKSIKVAVNSAAPSVSVSAKGKLDTMNPASAVNYTVKKLSNVAGSLVDVALAGDDSELFDVELDTSGSKPVARLTLSGNGEVATNKTYKLQLVFDSLYENEVSGSQTYSVSTNISFKVSQSTLKFAKVPTLNLYQSSQRPLTCTITLTSPAGARLDDAEIGLSSKTAAQFLQALGTDEIAVETDGSSAQISFRIKNPGYLVYGKSYTVYLDVTPANNATNVKPTQLKLTVKTYK